MYVNYFDNPARIMCRQENPVSYCVEKDGDFSPLGIYITFINYDFCSNL